VLREMHCSSSPEGISCKSASVQTLDGWYTAGLKNSGIINESNTALSAIVLESRGNPNSPVTLLSPAISKGPVAEHSIRLDRAVLGLLVVAGPP